MGATGEVTARPGSPPAGARQAGPGAACGGAPWPCRCAPLVIVLAVVVGLVLWVAFAPSGSPGGAGSAGAAEARSAASGRPTWHRRPRDAAERGEHQHPWGRARRASTSSSPSSPSTARPGGSGSRRTRSTTSRRPPSTSTSTRSTSAGGINGRKINPMIVQFDPANDAAMQALCRQWTEGSPAVFAVVDGIGTWTGANQLCVTEQGHTPLISAWSTTTNWTNLGSPYLWWTGADMAPVLAATVQWGLSSGRLGHGKKVGVVVSDQAARPGGAERLPAARPQEGRDHADGPDGGRQPRPDGHDQLRRPAGGRAVQGRPACSRCSRCYPRTPSSPTSAPSPRSSTSRSCC